jgi:CoA:oxalate CoA-transferase
VDGPLNDVLVVDLSRVLAGPYCTMVLADLGARVVKVERTGTGDDARHIGPFVGGRSAYFASINRNKESIALALDDDADRRVFEALLDRADVLVENFRPGVMHRLGYGWETARVRWPRLVYASVSGFGQTGPYAAWPAYDMVVQAMSGVMSITGPEGGDPTRVGTSIGDITAGLFAAVGIIAALRERDTRPDGAGQHVDVAMLDSQVAILENALARFAATGIAPRPIGTRHPSITPFGAFRARDGWVVIAAGNDRMFSRLCDVLGIPATARDERFTTNPRRGEHEPELRAEIERALAAQSVSEWLEVLRAADLPCAPINDIAAVVTDPQVRARNMLVGLDDPDMPIEVSGNPVKLSGHADLTTRPAAPELDRDGAAIREWLGLS